MLVPVSRRSAVLGAVATLVGLAGVVGTSYSHASAQTPPAPAATAPDDAAVALRGKPAPGFTLPDQNDAPRTLADSRGKWVVLAFYPADMTRGCTFQNVSYTRNIDKFAPLNATVYTISTQNTDSKKQFCSKEGLKHTLLSDVGGNTARAYGVLNGPVARRVTFYIAPDGTIADVDTKIKTSTAGEDSLARLAALQNSPTELRQNVAGQPATTKRSPAQFVGAATVKARIDQAVPDFSVVNVATGKTQAQTTLSAGMAATVLIFFSTECPVSKSYNARMENLATRYGSKWVAVVGIDANAGEDAAAVASYAKANNLTFPIEKDANSKVAGQFSARVTPEAYVIDSKGILVYHGAIDDSQDEAAVTHHYVADALDAVLAHKPVKVKTTRAFGCGIRTAP